MNRIFAYSKRVVVVFASALLASCVSIQSVDPDPAQPGETVSVGVKNVIGPFALEPGIELSFDGLVQPTNPNTSNLVGFDIPPGTVPGTHEIKVKDKIGLLEALTILPLFRDRVDKELITVIAPPVEPEFTAANACISGDSNIGSVDYNFEDDFDLVPGGGGPASYPDVDVRAVVRYPAVANGNTTAMPASGTFPLVVFLHGNHATCPCSCSHACTPNQRIPNHVGYNYLLDLLASWGIISVSIDGFDVTCAGSPTMSDYEARGRLVLRHLEQWQDWNDNGTDPWGGQFHNRVDMSHIGLSGHSRGGEGVVAAEFINRAEGLGYSIVAVNAIAPTDQDPFINYVPEVPYFLLMAAADGDVSNMQGLRTFDRTSTLGSPTQSEKSMMWVHGANHNFFNTAWTPGNGFMCASDDGNGGGRLTPELQQLVACQTIVPFFRQHLNNEQGFAAVFKNSQKALGLDGVNGHWAYQADDRVEVDNFDDGNGVNINSMGGNNSVLGGATTVFNEFAFRSGGGSFNGSFRGDTDGLVLGWNANRVYQTELPAGNRDVTGFTNLSFNASQILDGGVQNPVDAATTLRLSLHTAGGVIANSHVDIVGTHSLPYPYEDNGGNTVLGTYRIPLTSFRDDNQPLPLDDIETISIELIDQGLIAIDNIQFTQ